MKNDNKKKQKIILSGKGENNDQADLSYPMVAVEEDTAGFVASFQDKLMLLSPINAGVFPCNG